MRKLLRESRFRGIIRVKIQLHCGVVICFE